MTRDGTCGDCVHFRNDADHLERSFPGLTAMGSGRGAVRASDGLCDRHGLYLARFAHCSDIQIKATPGSAGVRRPAPAGRGRSAILSIRERFTGGGPR